MLQAAPFFFFNIRDIFQNYWGFTAENELHSLKVNLMDFLIIVEILIYLNP